MRSVRSAGKPQRAVRSDKHGACFLQGTLARGQLAAHFLLPGQCLTQVIALFIVQGGHRSRQKGKFILRSSHFTFGNFHFTVALIQTVHGSLPGRCGSRHFSRLFLQILTSKKGAVGLANAVAGPVRTKARQFAREVFFSATAVLFLSGQRCQRMTKSAFAFSQAAQGRQCLQKGLIQSDGVAAFMQKIKFFCKRGQMPFTAFARFLCTRQACLPVFGK